MIVVKIQGGIGNQLFQFALALSLKKRYPKKKVTLDTSFYNYQEISITYRQLYLDAFAINEFKIDSNNGIRKSNIFFKIKTRLISFRKRNTIIEKTKCYDPCVLQVKNPSYIIGYFQSYKYFETIDNDLRKQLILKRKLSIESEFYKNLILSKPISISIHIRRSDYLTKYKTIYHQLSIDYYKSAITLMKDKLAKLPIYVFVFSDDLNWCKENLVLHDEIIFIENSNKPDYEDLFLMSYCSHNIIANSTYSWWGAWLNGNSNKIIVAPSQWYKQQELNFSNSIYPSTWNVL